MTTLSDHLKAIKAVLKNPKMAARVSFDRTLAARMGRLSACGRGFKIFDPSGVGDLLRKKNAPTVQLNYLTQGLGHMLIQGFLELVSGGYVYVVFAPSGQSVKQVYLMVADDKTIGKGDDATTVTVPYPVRVLLWRGTDFDIVRCDDSKISQEAFAHYDI